MTSNVCRALFAAAGLALAFTMATVAAAQPNPTRTEFTGVLVLSGGVSLGAYEAGYLYATAEFTKTSEGAFRIPMLTGASAGSANAFITAINLCSPPNKDPTEDLGWQTWLPMDYRSLFDKPAVTPENVFTRRPLIEAFERVRTRWHQGLPTSCDVVIGMTVTRLSAEPTRVSRELSIPRQEEKFVFRIQGRGVGVAPRLSNYQNPNAHVPLPLLPFSEDDGDRAKADRNLDLVRDVVFASAAFPLAFSPVELTYCMTNPNAPTSDRANQVCTGALRRDKFIDGGVFDNNPLGLAHDTTEMGLVQTDRLRWLDHKQIVARTSTATRPRPTFVYLDPDTFAYPPFEEDDEAIMATNSIAGLLGDLTSSFVATARAKELYELVEGSPRLAQRMLLTIGNYPMASRELGAFIGFFDREFRRFDYYLGMYDAIVQSLRLARPSSATHRELTRVLAMHPSQISPKWRPVACMLGYFQPKYQKFRTTCDGEDMRDFRILMQVGLDRVYSHCGHLDPEQQKRVESHPHCEAAIKGGRPPRVDGVEAYDELDYRRGAEETQLGHVLRLMSAYRFHFKDLGLPRDEARYGRIKIRRKLLGMIEHIASAQQDTADSVVLLTAGRNLVNSIAYEPPKDWWYVSGGTAIEIGVSFLPFDWNESWARLHAAVQFAGAETLFSPDPVATRLSLTAGGELEPLFATTSYLQPILGLRAGWQFANRDTFGADACTESSALNDNRNCSQFALHSYFALGLFERIRLQLTLEWFPFRKEGVQNKLYDVQFGFGFQFL